MTRKKKILLGVLAVVLLFPVVAVGAAFVLFPSERVADIAAGLVEERLLRDVSIGDVGLSILPLGLSLEHIAVAGPAPGDSPVVAVERVLLRPRLLPLLRGDVLIDELRILRPRVAIRVDSAGESNLPEIVPDSTPSEPTGSIRFDVREIRVQRGVMTLEDAVTGRAARVDGFDQTVRLSGDVRDGRLARVLLIGGVAIDSIALRLPGDDDWTARGMRLALDHDASLLADSGVLRLDSVRVELQDIVMKGGGTIRGLTAADSVRVLDVRLAADPFDVGRLIASLPARLTAPLSDERAELSGTASVDATIRGAFGVDTFPAVEGRLELRDVSARREGQTLFTGLSGDIGFANDSIGSIGLGAVALGEPLRVAFRMTDPADPIVSFEIDGAIHLDRLRAAGLMPDSAPDLSGRVAAHVQGEVRRSRPDAARVRGDVRLQRLTLPLETGERVTLEDAAITLAGDSARLARTQVLLGGQPATVGGTVRGWLPVALGDSSALPTATFALEAPRLDLEPLLGPPPSPTFSQLVFGRLADAPVEERRAEIIATERGVAPPTLPRVRARGTLRVDTLISAGVVYTDLRAAVTSTPDRLMVEQATFGMMGGRGDIAAVLTPSAATDGDGTDTSSAAMHVLVQADMTGLASDPFLTRFTSFRDRAGGRLDVNGVVEMLLDARMLPVRETVQGRGVLTLRDARLVGWPLLRTLGDRLGTATFDTLRLREFTGGFDVVGPMVRFDDALLASEAGDARVAGSFTFDGRLDFGVDARLPARLAARGGSLLASAAAALADPSGEVPLGLRVAGMWRRPEVTPDLGRARTNAVDAAREAGRRQAERLAERGAAELEDRLGLGTADSGVVDSTRARAALPSIDSIGAAVDSARSAVESRVRDRIRGLF